LARIALGLEYDGTDYKGWQTQPGGNTVQDRLEAAIEQFTTKPHATICAGRTDAGVHAKGQVVHFDTDVDRPMWSWVRGLNALLPESIAVHWAVPVSDAFHARYSATAREYIYRIVHSPTRSPLALRTSTWFYQPLNLDAMQEAAKRLVGTHDFSAFRSAECQANSPIRTLEQFQIDQCEQMIVCSLRANAFLHHMVRNLVGAVVEVGRGARDIQWIEQVLRSRDRSQAARTFPAQGLCLEKVEYDSTLLCVPESKFVD
jgi:tRNA pseudouridine38-40 synthase